MAKRKPRQEALFVAADQITPSAGHPFYQKLTNFSMRLASTAAKAAYLDVLDHVLEDRRLDCTEMESLVTLATNFALVHAKVMTCHREYLDQLARVALATHVVTDTERADLSKVARLLGLKKETIEEALETARRIRLDTAAARSVTPENLRGLRVCFTGELQSTFQDQAITRDTAESPARLVF